MSMGQEGRREVLKEKASPGEEKASPAGEKASLGGENVSRERQALRVMEALSGVDEELLERCMGEGGRRFGRRRPLWQSVRPWAAALCLTVAGAAVLGGRRFFGGGADDFSGAAGGGADTARSMWIPEAEGAAEEGFCLSQDGAWQQALGEELTGEAEDAETGGGANAGGTGKEAGPNRDREEEGFEGPADGVGMVLVPEAGTATKDSLPSENGTASGDGAALEDVPSKGSMEAAREEERDSVEQGSSYTLEEARNLEGLGGYIPYSLPEGYVFESAVFSPEEESLTVSWSRGTDSLVLRILPRGDQENGQDGTDLSYPVFAREDLSLEVVDSCLTISRDKGDTATPGGRFDVLYPEDILVRFDGMGTAEEIWEMFCSVEDSRSW